MTSPESEAVCCEKDSQSSVRLTAQDFAALDQIAVKLICKNAKFSEPVWQIGRLLGERIAIEHGTKSVSQDEALSAFVSACGCECALRSRLLQGNPDGALLQSTGCTKVLGWEIPSVNRAVCGFDAGLLDGFFPLR